MAVKILLTFHIRYCFLHIIIDFHKYVIDSSFRFDKYLKRGVINTRIRINEGWADVWSIPRHHGYCAVYIGSHHAIKQHSMQTEKKKQK